jgi:hypothetical protein
MENNPLQNFNLEWATFECTLRFLQPALFNEFIGGVLRGAIGYGLRDVADLQTFNDLWLPSTADERLRARGYSDNPRPFILRIAEKGKRQYADGETLRFQFTLVGKAIEYLPYYIVALIRIGERGIGLKRSRCVLQSIDSIGPLGERRRVYDETELTYDEDFSRNRLADLPTTPPTSTISLTFQTPVHLRVFQQNVTPERFTMEIFLRRAIERIRSLGHLHADGEWFEVDQSLWEIPTPIQHQMLEWQTWHLWVSRSKQRVGGLVGGVTFAVDERFPFYQTLLAARWFNVGKKATYGFGTVEVEGCAKEL